VARYLIEVTHESETLACARAIKLLLQTGSHFLTHADFGCMDNDHRAWIVVEADSKEEARNLVPAIYRTRATVTGLNKFSLDEIDALIKQHGM
jgi:hypothetical protein